jgi:Prolipoprotein diacylglyceryl transferase
LNASKAKHRSNAANRALERLARTRFRLLRRDWPAFLVCGYTGLVFAIGLGAILVVKSGLSLWIISAIAVAAMATFLVLAFATKIITGEEQLIYYHHEIAIMLVSALVATLLHRPALSYMDVTILGVGTFLAFGRIGCLMVGCCHGRPCAWGIRYTHDHAQEGFAPYLVGVRLFPIQALESLFVFAVVIAGSIAVLERRPAGTAFALYTVGYGLVRFCLEFFRGDSDRPYTFGFSQGQWLSLWLMCGVAWAELTGRMTFHVWHLAITLAVPLIMLLAVVWRKLDRAETFRICHPHHVTEIAGAVDYLSGICRQPVSRTESAIPVACTSMGFQLSAGPIHGDTDGSVHFTISHRGRQISGTAASNLAELILQLKPGSSRRDLLPGAEEGVFHLVLAPAHTKGEAA